jgi:hypothetical protein
MRKIRMNAPQPECPTLGRIEKPSCSCGNWISRTKVVREFSREAGSW